MKNFIIDRFYIAGITVRTVFTKLENLYLISTSESESYRGPVKLMPPQNKGEYTYHEGGHKQISKESQPTYWFPSLSQFMYQKKLSEEKAVAPWQAEYKKFILSIISSIFH